KLRYAPFLRRLLEHRSLITDTKNPVYLSVDHPQKIFESAPANRFLHWHKFQITDARLPRGH
ncbi:MAG: hypothetical protein QMC11_04085, partial [Rhodospirillales bacterium]